MTRFAVTPERKEMVQNPNPRISDFRKRVEWAVRNLDPNPIYCRFVSQVNDVFKALDEATNDEHFAVGRQERVPGQRTWENALRENGVPRIYLEWLYTLYPDLTPAQLEAETLEQFLAFGKDVQAGRERWRPAIRYFAAHRAELAKMAKDYYRAVDSSHEYALGNLDFPLITTHGWIRSAPLPLAAHTEQQLLHYPDPGRTFEPVHLPGLRGDYVAYKGALAYATRRVVRTGPQHNGEIFCVQSVIEDDKGFVGFRYFLSRYFEYINTCEVLGAELADWVLSNPSSKLAPVLPCRGHPGNAFKLDSRASYPGVNCLSIFLNYSESRIPRGNYFLLHKRDETQLQAQNTVHVVPAGGHQGYAKGGWCEDTAIWRTMVREFCEELFDQEVLYKQPESWEDFLEIKTVREVKRLFFDGAAPAAKVYVHGFGLDPITLKPEVLITIVIDWNIVLMRADRRVRLKFNWELQNRVKKAGTRHQWVHLSRDNLLREAKGRVQTIGDDNFLDTLPAGAACMMQTARHYEFLGLPRD